MGESLPDSIITMAPVEGVVLLPVEVPSHDEALPGPEVLLCNKPKTEELRGQT